MWYWNSNLRAKGYVTGFPLFPKMLQLTNRRNKTQAQIMKWHLWAGTKLPGMAQKTGSSQDKPAFLLSEFTTAPVVQHSRAMEQLLDRENVSSAVKESMHMAHTRIPTYGWYHLRRASFPGLRSQLRHEGLIRHVTVMTNRECNFSWNISGAWLFQKIKWGKKKGGVGWGEKFMPIVWFGGASWPQLCPTAWLLHPTSQAQATQGVH